MPNTWPRNSRSRLLPSNPHATMRKDNGPSLQQRGNPNAFVQDHMDVPLFESTPVETRSTRLYAIRIIALLCACSLSIGSHYASYILGPLKTRLSREMGTSNTEFSLLIAAFSLNSTWAPLLGGLLAGKFGTTFTSILATGLIFFGKFTAHKKAVALTESLRTQGQAVLLVGDMVESVRLMTLGMFIFGLGVSPLSVVQESIIVRFFKHHGLGLSMAFGLVVGKASSFVSARTSYPLSEHYGPRAPFVVATVLAFLSFAMNLVYLLASKWLVKSSGTELEASELRDEAHVRQLESVSEAQALRQVAEKKKVHLRDITKLGDVFWAYIGINVLCGAIWSPFTHLAPNIIQQRYGLSEMDASNKASFLLAGSIFLYPIVGSLVDRFKNKPVIQLLLVTSSTLTLLCYFWLWLPPSFTGTPVPSIAAFCVGQGFAPLLLVVIVPTLVSSKYVPTTLGAHKSLEQTGTTIFQTFAGLYLDKKSSSEGGNTPLTPNGAIDSLLRLFLFLNVLQLVGIVGLWGLDKRRKRQAVQAAIFAARSATADPLDEDPTVAFDLDDEESPKSPTINRLSFVKIRRVSESHSLQRRDSTIDPSVGTPPDVHSVNDSEMIEEEIPLLGEEMQPVGTQGRETKVEEIERGVALSRGEVLRGEIFGILGICAILFAWAFFIITALHRLRSKEDRQDE